jgi:hypothetical protein
VTTAFLVVLTIIARRGFLIADNFITIPPLDITHITMQNIPVFSAAHQAKFERAYSDPLAGRRRNHERPSQQEDAESIEMLWSIRRMSMRRIQSQIDEATIARATSSVIASTDAADSDSDSQDEPTTPTHRDDSSSVTDSRRTWLCSPVTISRP